ncbi:HD domain-containing protein, partial [bacterium]|nr:HD domain-containing protein [bacterium]
IIFPEIVELAGVDQVGKYHHKDVFEHTLKVVDNLAEVTDNLNLRFAGLVHDIGKPKVKEFVKGTGWTFHGHELTGVRMLTKICPRLKLSKNMCKYVQKLTRLHMRPVQLVGEEVTDSAIRRLIVHAGEELNDLMVLCRADITSGNQKRVKQYIKNFDYVMERIEEVKEKDKMRAFQSPVRGDEIMKVCGVGPGPQVGALKKTIEEAILDGKIPNEHDAAYEYLLGIKDEFIINGNK